MHILLTQRKLASGSYDEWKKAWMSEDQEWPTEAIKAYVLRNVDDPDDVIAFGMFSSDPREGMFKDPAGQEYQRERMARMAPFVVSTGADGLYEVVEEVTRS